MSEGLKIYGFTQSRAARCLWMARELGVAHENIPIPFTKAKQSPDLIKVNPNARIPAIEDDGFKLYESMAINLYLARKYGAGKDIAVKTLEDEALATQWSFWVMTEIEKPLLSTMLHVVGMRPSDEATIAQYKAEMDAPFKVLDAHLADRPYLLGDTFTVADLNVASVLTWARVAKLDLSAYPKVGEWLKRCYARPAFKG